MDLRLAAAVRSWLRDAEEAGLRGRGLLGGARLDPDAEGLGEAGGGVEHRQKRRLPAGTLEIEFVSGNVYRYLDVPEDLYRELMRAQSIGTFFNERIRDRFPSEGPLEAQ